MRYSAFHHGAQFEEFLPRHNPAFDDPKKRAAVQHLGAAPGHVASDMDQLLLLLAARHLRQALLLPSGKLGKGRDAHSKLEEMQGHVSGATGFTE